MAHAAPRPHVVTFGKATSARLFVGPNEDKPLDLKIRPLYVDGKLKEFTFGSTHEITEHVFVVRRIVRINDALVDETSPRWGWQRSGWLVVDRVSAHIAQAVLSDFDPDYSVSAWFRDYVAYCGMSDDGKKLFAIVSQLGRRKAILRRPLGADLSKGSADEACETPTWQRQPTRVVFAVRAGEKFTYEVRRHSVEAITEDDDGSSE